MCTKTYFTEFILLIPMKHANKLSQKVNFTFQKYMHFLNLINLNKYRSKMAWCFTRKKIKAKDDDNVLERILLAQGIFEEKNKSPLILFNIVRTMWMWSQWPEVPSDGVLSCTKRGTERVRSSRQWPLITTTWGGLVPAEIVFISLGCVMGEVLFWKFSGNSNV